MSGDLPYDPDHNPPLSQVLAKGESHLVKRTKATDETAKPLNGIEPKPPIEPRPTAKQITYDPDAYRDPFGPQR